MIVFFFVIILSLGAFGSSPQAAKNLSIVDFGFETVVADEEEDEAVVPFVLVKYSVPSRFSD